MSGHYDLNFDATVPVELEYEYHFYLSFANISEINTLKISTIKIATCLTIIFINTSHKIFSGTIGGPATPTNPKVVFATIRTSIPRIVTL